MASSAKHLIPFTFVTAQGKAVEMFPDFKMLLPLSPNSHSSAFSEGPGKRLTLLTNSSSLSETCLDSKLLSPVSSGRHSTSLPRSYVMFNSFPVNWTSSDFNMFSPLSSPSRATSEDDSGMHLIPLSSSFNSFPVNWRGPDFNILSPVNSRSSAPSGRHSTSLPRL